VLPVTGGPLFVATVSGAEITSANNLGLWAADASGGVELLLRKGDQLEIDGQPAPWRRSPSSRLGSALPDKAGTSTIAETQPAS
jgi:hypothetical protein